MKNSNYDIAYAEVIEVLNYIPIEDYNKIPKKFITFLEENCDENCSFKYNIALGIEKQNLSNDAKNILAVIYRLFLANDMEKKELNDIDKLIKIENEKKYNADNLFKKSETQEVEKNTQLTKYEKESLLKRVLAKIKKAFIKNK